MAQHAPGARAASTSWQLGVGAQSRNERVQSERESETEREREKKNVSFNRAFGTQSWLQELRLSKAVQVQNVRASGGFSTPEFLGPGVFGVLKTSTASKG